MTAGRQPIITVTDQADARVKTVVEHGLQRYNVQQSGIDDVRPLTVVVNDGDTHEVLGGITGRTSLLRAPRVAHFRRDPVRSARDQPRLHDEDSVIT